MARAHRRPAHPRFLVARPARVVLGAVAAEHEAAPRLRAQALVGGRHLGLHHCARAEPREEVEGLGACREQPVGSHEPLRLELRTQLRHAVLAQQLAHVREARRRAHRWQPLLGHLAERARRRRLAEWARRRLGGDFRCLGPGAGGAGDGLKSGRLVDGLGLVHGLGAQLWWYVVFGQIFGQCHRGARSPGGVEHQALGRWLEATAAGRQRGLLADLQGLLAQIRYGRVSRSELVDESPLLSGKWVRWWLTTSCSGWRTVSSLLDRTSALREVRVDAQR